MWTIKEPTFRERGRKKEVRGYFRFDGHGDLPSGTVKERKGGKVETTGCHGVSPFTAKQRKKKGRETCRSGHAHVEAQRPRSSQREKPCIYFPVREKTSSDRHSGGA